MEPNTTPPQNNPVNNDPSQQPPEAGSPTPPADTPTPRTDLSSFQFDQTDQPAMHQMPGAEIRPGGATSIVDTPAPSGNPAPVAPDSVSAEQPMPSQAPTPQPTFMDQPVSPPAPEQVAQPQPEQSMQPVAMAQPTIGSTSPVHSANNWQRWRHFGIGKGKGMGMSGAQGMGAVPGALPQSTSKLKTYIIAGAAVVVVAGGVLAYYFGYYMSPNVIWSQSIGNMSKGYDNLVSYLNTTSNAHYKGVSESGSFNYQSGSGGNYDGSVSFKSDGNNTTGSVNVGVGLTRVDIELRSMKAAGSTTPDVYLQLNGIKGLGDSLGSTFGQQVNMLDGQWIAIDHTFIEDIKNQVTSQQSQAASTAPQLGWADIQAAAKALGDVNKQYVFTTNKNKAVTTVVKKYGFETINGQKTYHYQVGFVKQNVKSYITALRDALKGTKLGSWIQTETGKPIDDAIGYNNLEQSADRIKSSDTIDVWANSKTRLIYKIRVNDSASPAENYVEYGLNYTGGDTYPFFINSKSQTSTSTDTGTFSASLNTKTNVFTLSLVDNTTGDSKSSLTGNFTFQPNNNAVQVTAPTNAKSLSAVLDELGLSDVVNALIASKAAAVSGSSTSDMTNMGSMGSSM